MKLSQILIDYRQRMNISQRELSRRCDLSNTYISFLEKEMNPKTGKPLVPTLEQYKKLADGMGMSVQELFERLDKDAPVDISSGSQTPNIFVPDSETFAKILYYMDRDDYLTVMEIFDKTYKRMKAMGVELKMDGYEK